MPTTEGQQGHRTTRDIVEELARCFPAREEAYALLESLDVADLREFPAFGTVPAVAFWQHVVDHVRKVGPGSIATLLTRAANLRPDSKVFLSSDPDSAEKDTVKLQIRIDGNFDELRAEDVKRIMEILRGLSKNVSVTITSVHEGSIKLNLDCSEETAKYVSALFDRGELTVVDGLKLLSVEIIQDAAANSDPQTKESIPSTSREIRLFISYSHKDEELRQDLEAHLAVLRRQGVVSVWTDRMITAGQEWAKAIDDNLDSADIILLLVSAYFVSSDYCYDTEMIRAIQRHDDRQAIVIPIVGRPVDWSGTPFSKLLVLPTDAKPVTSWDDMHAAWADVAVGIRRATHELQRKRNKSA